MKTKQFLILAIASAFFLACKDKEPAPPESSEPTFSGKIAGTYYKLSEATINKPLDLDVDGDSSTNLFDEIYGYLDGNQATLSGSADHPAGYFNFQFITNCSANTAIGYYFPWFQFLYLLKIDDETRSIEVISRYNENHDENSGEYVYMKNIEADGEKIAITSDQRYLVWDSQTRDFYLEDVETRYVYERGYKR